MKRTPLHSTLYCSLILTAIGCNDGSLTTKNVNANPEATIILPDSNDGGDVEDGTTVLFRAVVSDADTADQDTLMARWRVDSNPEYACDYTAPDENGETSCEIAIEVGMEKVIVEVKDQNNGVGSDEYLLNVIETVPPEIELLSPTVEGLYKEGVAITFEAVVSDEEDEPEELVVTWASDLAGDLELEGEVSSFGLFESEGMLLEGTHLVTATVTDTNGKSASDSVEIVVGPAVAPIIDFVDIQNTGGLSLDEAFDGQTVVCASTATHPEDAPLTWTYAWNNDAGTDITVDPTSSSLTLDYAGQGLAAGENVTCTATVSDGSASVSDSDSVPLIDCSPFAPEIPYDGIDSNCDGLETLNDQDGDGQPDTDKDFDADDDYADMHNGSTNAQIEEDPRVGVECLGEAFSSNGGMVYYLLCDADLYWKDADAFCQDNGYDSLATFHTEAEMDHAKTLIDGFFKPDGSRLTDAAMVGFTRGPDCSPSTVTGSPYPSVCGSNISNYYWIDNGDASWVTSNHWADTNLSGSVEHCGQLISSANHYGFWDVYCEYSSNSYWSKTYTNSRPIMCMKRQ